MPCDLPQMICFIIGLPCLPQSPDDVQPTIGQAAVGVGFGVAPTVHLVKVSGGPNGLAGGGLRQLLHRVAIAVITSAPEFDLAGFAGGDRHRACAGDAGQDGAVRIALTMVAEHDQQLRS